MKRQEEDKTRPVEEEPSNLTKSRKRKLEERRKEEQKKKEEKKERRKMKKQKLTWTTLSWLYDILQLYMLSTSLYLLNNANR